MRSTLTRPGPNGTLPHGTPAARTHHLAHGQVLCTACRAAEDSCDGCVAALADALRAEAGEIVAMAPAGRLEVPCGACGRGRTYALTEVP